MSKTLNRILGTSNKLPEESEDYKPLVMTGGRPCMGFSIIQSDGNMSAFLYHSLDNLVTHPSIDGQELLAFTHRGTAVTIRGRNLRKVLRAIMSHTLQEIWEQDGRPLPEGDDYPTVEKIAVTHLNMPPELRSFFDPAEPGANEKAI